MGLNVIKKFLSFFQNKKKVFSFFGVVVIILIIAGMLFGSIMAIKPIFSSKQDSPDFTSSVKARIKVDPTSFLLKKEDKQAQDKSKAQEILKTSAQKLSSWMKNNKQPNYDVYYEIGDEKVDGHYYGYLSVNFPFEKVKSKVVYSKEDEKEFIKNDPYLTFFNNQIVNTNNRTFVYRWYTPNESISQANKPEFSVLKFENIFDFHQTKIINNSNGDCGIIYRLKDNNHINEIYNDLLKAFLDSKKSDNKAIKNWQKPRLYIFNNLEGLINEANYHCINYNNNHSGKNSKKYRQIYHKTDYEKFAKEYKEGKSDKELDNGSASPSINNYQFLNNIKYHKNNKNDSELLLGGDILNFLDIEPGKVRFDFINKYLENTIQFNENDFQKYFPKKITDLYKNKISESESDIADGRTKLQYFWRGYELKKDAEKYLNDINQYHLSCNFALTDFSNFDIKDESQKSAVFNEFKKDYHFCEFPSPFTNSLFGKDKLVKSLSWGLIVFLLLLFLVLLVLYRFTGFMSWLCILLALAVSFCIVMTSIKAISLSFMIGLFIVAIVGFIIANDICLRIKKRLNCTKEEISVILNKSFKSNLSSSFDISVVSLLFGICFTFIAPFALNSLGLLLVIGAFANFFCVYLLNAFLHFFFFANSLFSNKYWWLGKKPKQNNLSMSTSDNRFEFAYFSQMNKINFQFLQRKTFFILIGLAILLLVGIIFFIIFGFFSNNLFHKSMCLVIKYDASLLEQPFFQQAELKYFSSSYYDGWWYFYTDNVTQLSLDFLTKVGQLKLAENCFLQEMVGTTNQDIFSFGLVAILLATLISSVYLTFRTHWSFFIPMLIGSFVIPLFTLGMSAICLLPLNEITILGLVFVAVISSVSSVNYLEVINKTWNHKAQYSNQEFKFMINTVLKNNWTFIWTLSLVLGLFFICFVITSPIGCLHLSLLILIGLLSIVLINPFVLSYLLYFFLKIRNKIFNHYLDKMQNKVRINYDDIDEQSIEGINKFTKPWMLKQNNEKK